VLMQIFDADVNAPISGATEGGHVIARVTDFALPDASIASAEDLEKVRTQNQQALGADLMASYMNKLSGKYKVRLNKRLLDQMYAPQAQVQ